MECEPSGGIAPHASDGLCAESWLGGVLAVVEAEWTQRARLARRFSVGAPACEPAAAIFFPAAAQFAVEVAAGDVVRDAPVDDFGAQAAVAVIALGETRSQHVEANAPIAPGDRQGEVHPVVGCAVPFAGGGFGRRLPGRR